MAPSTRQHLRFASATAAIIAMAGGALLLYVWVPSSLVQFTGLLLLALLGMGAGLFPLVRGTARSLRRNRTGRSPAALTSSRGAERILVVDDERVVRELLARMLREEGYEVSVAGSAREARALESRWDLLVTDVVMPQTDGIKLAQQIDARHVLFISGYDQEALVRADAFFLRKPFSRDDLARTVREMLDGERAAQPAAA